MVCSLSSGELVCAVLSKIVSPLSRDVIHQRKEASPYAFLMILSVLPKESSVPEKESVPPEFFTPDSELVRLSLVILCMVFGTQGTSLSVSYTHLTLPTRPLV